MGEGPTIALDYFYLGQDDTDTIPHLAAKDNRFGCYAATAVEVGTLKHPPRPSQQLPCPAFLNAGHGNAQHGNAKQCQGNQLNAKQSKVMQSNAY